MDSLETVYIEVTDRCYKTCKHCLNGINNNKSRKILSLDELKHIAIKIKQSGAKYVKIVGGEPLTRRDIQAVLKTFDEQALEIILFTDDYRISSMTYFLKELNSLNNVRVSLDGNREIHDSIRTKGDFNDSINSMATLSKEGILCFANYTINNQNYHCIEDVYQILNKHSVDIKFGLVKWCENIKNDADLGFNDHTIYDFMRYLMYLRNRNRDLYIKVIEDIQDVRDFVDRQKMCSYIGCYAGQKSCLIDTNGNVWPCGMLKNNDMYTYGNILKEDFSVIWKNMNSIWANISPDFHCQECEGSTYCTGGCRANALFLNGSINSKDPNCLLYCNHLDYLLTHLENAEKVFDSTDV